MPRRRDRDAPKPTLGIGNGLHTVPDQIVHHLLQLHFIAGHDRQPILKIEHQVDLPGLQIVFEKNCGIGSHGVDIEAGPLSRLINRHSMNSLYDSARPARGFHKAVQAFKSPFDCRRRRGEPSCRRTAVRRNRRQRLPEFVGNGCRQFAEHRNATRVRELVLQLAKLRLRVQAVRYIEHADETIAINIVHRRERHRHQNIDDSPVDAADLRLLVIFCETAKSGVDNPP